MEKTGLIYKAKNTVNGKVYIGQTSNTLNRRKSRHLRECKTYNTIFGRALRKYGEDSFQWDILEDNIPLNELNSKEVNYISLFDSTNRSKGYNMTPGGDAAPKGNRKIGIYEVNQIIDLLRNTSYTLKEIGDFYGISNYAISDINRGKSWTNKDSVYPVRKKKTVNKRELSNKYTKYQGSISEEEVVKIIELLKDGSITNKEIEKTMNISPISIASVNNGKNLLSRKHHCSFPIRKDKITMNSRIEDSIDSIISNIKQPEVPFHDIAKKYHISESTISNINSGKIHKKINESYPLRERTISSKRGKMLSIDQVKEIADLLHYSSVSMKKISEVYEVSKTTIRSINLGKIWFDHIDHSFPIRKHDIV